MPDQRCIAIDTKTGRRCRSLTLNTFRRCNRHHPSPPTKEKLALALAEIQAVVAEHPFEPCPPNDFKGKSSEELERLWAESQTHLYSSAICEKYRSLWVICEILGVKSEFCEVWSKANSNCMDWLYRGMTISDKLRELRETTGDYRRLNAI
jgi:hypothetical protein